MKNSILLLLIVTLLSCSTNNDIQPTKAPPLNINSGKKITSIETIQLKNGVSNTLGRRTYLYNSNGTLNSSHHNKYSENYKYENNLLQNIETYNEDGLVGYTEHLYNSDLTPSKYNYLKKDTDGSFILKKTETYEYNEQYNLSKVTSVDHEYGTFSTYTNYYWKQNNIIKQEVYSLDGTLKYVFDYEYDNKNNFEPILHNNARHTSKNNVKDLTVTDYTGFYENCRGGGCEPYKYKYNQEGYPLEIYQGFDAKNGYLRKLTYK